MEESNKENKEIEQHYSMQSKKFKQLEIILWGGAGIGLMIPNFIRILKKNESFNSIDLFHAYLIGLTFILFPYLVNLIFGKLPFQVLRERRKEYQPTTAPIGTTSNLVVQDSDNIWREVSFPLDCINESKAISDKIYNRSGVYLLVGCLIAFIGVGIFNSPIFKTSTSHELTDKLVDYLPRFGALFFVEFIAFFFLKQYKIMLEEYRYYEAIKRKRQDNYNMLELIEKYKDKPELLKIISENMNQSVITKLANGETTEILEAQKIINQDMDLFSKISDFVKLIKS